MMKKIEAYIQPSRLDALKDALIQVGISGMTVYQVQGFGRQRGYRQGEKGAGGAKFLDKVKMEIVVEDEQVERILGIIADLAQTGTIGAGKVFVIPVEDALRVGTGETGTAAIH